MKLLIQAMFTLVVLTAVAMAATSEENLKIAAFNIQVFGRTKAANEEVMDIIVKIIQRYDICLVQEIRDNSGEAIEFLLTEVNEGDHKYEMTLSERLGRTSSKEQYAFLYRTDIGLTVSNTYQDPDHNDVFEREPYGVRFHSEATSIDDFILVGIHISPGDAFDEINALKDVHDTIVEHLGLEDVLILGDFNAGCSYVSKKKMGELLLNTPDYQWLISDDVDTTVGASECAYDRFVMTGDKFLSSYVPNSAQVFNFDEAYNLSDEQTKAVSDHYPIELELYRTKIPSKDDDNGDDIHEVDNVPVDEGLTDDTHEKEEVEEEEEEEEEEEDDDVDDDDDDVYHKHDEDYVPVDNELDEEAERVDDKDYDDHVPIDNEHTDDTHDKEDDNDRHDEDNVPSDDEHGDDDLDDKEEEDDDDDDDKHDDDKHDDDFVPIENEDTDGSHDMEDEDDDKDYFPVDDQHHADGTHDDDDEEDDKHDGDHVAIDNDDEDIHEEHDEDYAPDDESSNDNYSEDEADVSHPPSESEEDIDKLAADLKDKLEL